MQKAAVVPNHQVTDPPPVTPDEHRLGGMQPKELKQDIGLVPRQFIDAGVEPGAEKERVAAGIGMGANERMTGYGPRLSAVQTHRHSDMVRFFKPSADWLPDADVRNDVKLATAVVRCSRLERPESPAELHELDVAQSLVTKQQDKMVQPRLPNLAKNRIVDALQPAASHLGPKR